MQEVYDASSWLLRTHYSRAVCHSTGRSACGNAPAMDWLNLDTTSVIDIPKRRQRNDASHESSGLVMQNIDTTPIEHAPSLSAYCLKDNNDLISSLKSDKQIDQSTAHRFSTGSSHGEQFSFVSSGSSSRNSLSSKTLGCNSPPSDTCFSPTSELRNDYNFEPAMPDPQTGAPPSTDNLPSISHDTNHNHISHGHDHHHNDHHHNHHHFLRAVLSSISRHHSRSSSSSSLCDNSHALSNVGHNHNQDHDHHHHNHHHHHHLHLSSLLKRLNFVSPKASPLASPTSQSPVVSPKNGSPTTSPDHTACGHVDVSDKKAMAPSMKRVPSWSHHFSSSNDGEKAVVSAEEWMLDLSQLFIGERFASGRHSRLYHGMYRDLPVAVKVIRPPDEDETLSDRVEEIFNQEVTTLSRLQHHNIIKFIGACKKPPLLCVITEYLPGGSLRGFLHKREGELLPISTVLKMALDIAYGMEYLHTAGIIHRDLKSENLVLDEDGTVKIVDFGVSCFEFECSSRLDDLGTYRWMAPEMLGHKPYSKKVDVYSFGIVLWELITTRLPFEDMGAVQAAYSVINQNNRPPIPTDCPPQLADLMSHCWSSDPEQRPDFWEILRSLNVYKETLEEQQSYLT